MESTINTTAMGGGKGRGGGRKKIPMRKIEDKRALQVTFSKRRKGVFKKAEELSVLCGVDIAIVAFSPAGKPFVFSHPSPADSIIARYLSASSSSLGGNADAEDEDAPLELEPSGFGANHCSLSAATDSSVVDPFFCSSSSTTTSSSVAEASLSGSLDGTADDHLLSPLDGMGLEEELWSLEKTLMMDDDDDDDDDDDEMESLEEVWSLEKRLMEEEQCFLEYLGVA